jgi:endo-1,4-beta-xylanase
MKFGRRDYIRLMGAQVLGAAYLGWPSSAAMAEEAALPRLRELAMSKGIRYGSDSDKGFMETPQFYRHLFTSQCSLYAPNISWKHVSHAQGIYDFLPEQQSLDFARTNGLKLTGGHLLWDKETPGWFTAIDNPKEAQKVIGKHIDTMVARFRGQTYSWNVVNEAIDIKAGRSDGLLGGPISPDYFDDAFRRAHAGDPDALMVYNDHSMEIQGPQYEARRSALFRLLDRLQKQGTPIQAVGLQSHMHVRGFQFSEEAYRAFLHDIAARGLKIIISELDVFDELTVSDIRTRDRVIASIYERLLTAALDEPAVCAVVTWGLSDRYTWLIPESSPIFRRSDGLPARPLPFDARFQPKPAFYAIVNAFRAAPERVLR